MDTAEALKRAMQAIKDAGIPESMWESALPLALADLRAAHAGPADPVSGVQAAANGTPAPAKASPKSKPKSATKRSATARPAASSGEPGILAALGDDEALFAAVEKNTGVPVVDLRDLFHVEGGRLEIKAAGRELGTTVREGAQTVAALLGGIVFAGTDVRKLPFREINDICRVKNLFDSGNAASSLKATPGFASVGSGTTLALTSKSGWNVEFTNAVNRALGRKPQPAT